MLSRAGLLSSTLDFIQIQHILKFLNANVNTFSSTANENIFQKQFQTILFATLFKLVTCQFVKATYFLTLNTQEKTI